MCLFSLNQKAVQFWTSLEIYTVVHKKGHYIIGDNFVKSEHIFTTFTVTKKISLTLYTVYSSGLAVLYLSHSK